VLNARLLRLNKSSIYSFIHLFIHTDRDDTSIAEVTMYRGATKIQHKLS